MAPGPPQKNKKNANLTSFIINNLDLSLISNIQQQSPTSLYNTQVKFKVHSLTTLGAKWRSFGRDSNKPAIKAMIRYIKQQATMHTSNINITSIDFFLTSTCFFKPEIFPYLLSTITVPYINTLSLFFSLISPSIALR